MKNDLKELSQWVETWRRAGAELEKLRRANIKNSNVAEALFNLSDASESALLHNKPAPSSGLVEMQKWFKLLRKADDTDS